MAWVEKAGDRWRAGWRDPDTGRKAYRSFKSKADADRYATAVEHSIDTETYLDPRGGRTPFGEYAVQWMAQQSWRPQTRDAAESYMRSRVLPVFGPRPIGSIRRTHVQGWVTALAAELAPATVGQVYHYLAAPMKGAVVDGLIPASPCQEIRLPEKTEAPVIPLAVEQVEALIAALPERYRAVGILSASTGMRIGECLALMPQHVLWTQREIRVRHTLVSAKGRGTFLGPPKTKKAYRTIPVNDDVLIALSEQLRQWPSANDLGVIFATARSDRPMPRNRWQQVWDRTRERAGVPDSTVHDFRHHYASVLIAEGLNVKVIQRVLGHATASETLDTYGHLFPGDEGQVRDALRRGRVRLGAREA